jgi:hypothetical protein
LTRRRKTNICPFPAHYAAGGANCIGCGKSFSLRRSNPRKPTLDEATAARLAEFADIAESGATEMTGRLIRGGDRDDVVGRFGGVKKSYPELLQISAGPKRIAATIRKGKGKAFETIRGLMAGQLSKAGFAPGRKRSPGKRSVAAHTALARCAHCGELHTRGQHRFHGKGAFHQTHLWGFNPPAPAKAKRIGRVRKIWYDRDQGNRQGAYYHIFTRKAAGLWTEPNGKVSIR